MAFIGLRWLGMITVDEQMKPALGRLAADADKFGQRELLMRKHIADQPLPMAAPAFDFPSARGTGCILVGAACAADRHSGAEPAIAAASCNR